MDKVFSLLSFSQAPSYHITGNFDYHLDVTVTGEQPYQTSTLSITAYTKSNKKIAIAVACKWYRIKEEREYHLTSIHSNAYQLSAEDINHTLKVQVEPLEDDFEGIATVTYGPIRMDPNVRSTLENILGAGGSKFSVNFVDENSGKVSNESASIALTSDYIRLVETPSRGKERSCKFRYCYGMPQMELNYQDVNRMIIYFKGDEEDIDDVKKFLGAKKGPYKVGVRFLTRTSRDLFIMSFKFFGLRNYLPISREVNEIDFSTDEQLFQDNPKSDEKKTGDILLEVDSIKREMYLVLGRNMELSKDKELLQTNIKRLEEELSSTIETYSQLISELKQQDDSQTNSEADSVYKQKVEDLENEIQQLRAQLSSVNTPTRRSVNSDYDRFASINKDKRYQQPAIFENQNDAKVRILEEENSELKFQLEQAQDEMRNYRDKYLNTPNKKLKGTYGEEALSTLQVKFNDVKAQNEALLRDLNFQKQRNDSLQTEIDIVRNELNKLQQAEESTSQMKEKIHKDAVRGLELSIENLQKDKLVLKQRIQQLETPKPAPPNFALQKENASLKNKIAELEKVQTEYNNLRFQQIFEKNNNSGQKPSSNEANGESTAAKAQSSVDLLKLQSYNESLLQDLSKWKTKVSSLEIELAKMQQENRDSTNGSSQTPQKQQLNDSQNSEIESIISKYSSSKSGSSGNQSKKSFELFEDTMKENDKLYSETTQLKSKITIMEIQLQTAKVELDNLKRSGSSSSNMEIIKLQKEIQNSNTLNQQLKKELQKITEDYNNLKYSSTKSNESSSSEADRLKKENQKLAQENAKFKSDLKALAQKMDELTEKLKQTETKYTSLEREKQYVDIEFNSMKTKNEALKNEVSYLRNEVSTLRKSIESPKSTPSKSLDYKSKYDDLLEKYELLQEQNEKLSEELSFANEKLERSYQGAAKNEEYASAKAKIQQLESELAQSKDQIAELKSKANSSSSDTQELKEKTTSLNQQIKDQRERISELEKVNEELRLTQTRNSVRANGFDTNRSEIDNEVEQLRSENESLIQQRNQIAKKVETLSKELENHMKNNSQAMIENLMKTNERLINENTQLMDQIRNLNDEIDMAKNGSMLSSSRYDGDDASLRERVKELERDLQFANGEKDKLLVQMSKMVPQPEKQQAKKKGIFDFYKDSR